METDEGPGQAFVFPARVWYNDIIRYYEIREAAMLTISDVRSLVGNSAYFARGRIYADEGRVSILACEENGEGAVSLSARVLGSGENYAVDVCFDAGALVTCSCGCPAFARISPAPFQ